MLNKNSLTPIEIRYLKKWYNSKVRVSPAMLAIDLKISLNRLINIMSKLGIRKKGLERY